MKNIAIIFGGKSVEHDISIITALQMMEQMKKKYNLFPVYIKTNGQMCTADNLMEAMVKTVVCKARWKWQIFAIQAQITTQVLCVWIRC